MLNCNPTRNLIDTESKLGPEETSISDPTLYQSLAGSSLVAYSNADWAGCPATRRSISRYCVLMGDNILSWSAKRQHTLLHSSVEAKYRGVANVVTETTWLCNLLREIYTPLLLCIVIISPNLEILELQASEIDSVTLEGYSDIWLEHLNEFAYDDLGDSKLNLELVKLILAKSPLLKKVRITLCNKVTKVEELKICKVRLRSTRASPMVDIIVEAW
nr:ribonuclease H-like domain-containing protein [Tanacetum cinerariifolium]GEV29094.1 ribonuclease H-like domain-containing protein [Tanacetum cinerariifolium]